MAKEAPLYEDESFRISNNPEFPEDHRLLIKPDSHYVFPRGTLKDFSFSDRKFFESRINYYQAEILHVLGQRELPADALHIAMLRAYIEDEGRIQRGIDKMRPGRGGGGLAA